MDPDEMSGQFLGFIFDQLKSLDGEKCIKGGRTYFVSPSSLIREGNWGKEKKM